MSTAYAPVPAMLTSLQRAGWGDLAGREWQGVRTTLHALASRLPHGSGQGFTTVEQVAASAGLSRRWVARCMDLLEQLGVIEWTRGGVYKGTPRPSWVRIVKRTLLALITAARPQRTAAEQAHAAATRARIAHLRWVKGRPRRSHHVELSASPPTPRGEAPPPSLAPGRADPPTRDAPMPEDVRRTIRDAIRAGRRTRR